MKTLNEAFAALRNTAFMPLTGDHYVSLVRLSETSFHARLYRCLDRSKPTWPIVVPDPENLRYYEERSFGDDIWIEVSDEKIAINPAEFQTLAMISFLADGTPVVSMMRPTISLTLVELATWLPSATPLAAFVEMIDHRTSFSQKEILELIHRADCAMIKQYGLGAKQRALRMHIDR